jgi:FtsP/CotA-like multicopper oxidase with cupredoxin domain
MNAHERLVQKTIDLHREIIQANLTRRDLLKMGLLTTTTGMLLPISGLSLRAAHADDDKESCPISGLDIISPLTRPWIEEMPRLFEKQVVAGNNPANINRGNGGGAPSPDPVGTLTGGDSKIRLRRDFPKLFRPFPEGATPFEFSHQAWGKPTPFLGNHPPQLWYELREKQANHVWHPDLPAGNTGQPIWGYDGVYPGPQFRTRYGVSHFVRIHNDLPARNLGFSINQTSAHLHNMHTPSESDGNPLYTNYAGHYWDYHYPNLYAGVKQYGGLGDSREALGTMFYHDHKLDFTAQNVYAGLIGLNFIYDELDSGDPDEAKGLRLPCGPNFEFDVGLVFHDRQFDTNGADFFPLFCFDGAVGDKMTVNGKIQPYFPVKRRKYRFRMLDIGPSRDYWWYLRDEKTKKYVPFTVIANDGNLLPVPVVVASFKQAVAERFDIILDFSKYLAGQELILLNRALQNRGRGPSGELLKTGYEVLKFIVTSDSVQDNSVIPAKLRDLPNISQAISKTRRWEFGRGGGEWVTNNEPFDRDLISATIPEGSAERWTVINDGGSWTHPIHPHYEEHRFLKYNGAERPNPSAPLEIGRKDVIRLDPNAKAEIYIRFRDFRGQYVMHCHNVVHEDHAMMVNWKIV